MHRSRLGTIVIDCHADDAGPAAEFWSRALGWAAQPLAHPDDANYRELATPPSEVKVLVQAVAHPSSVHVDTWACTDERSMCTSPTSANSG